MRRAVAVSLSLLACFAFAGSARAQDEEPVYATASEAHRPDRWSMQFEVGDDFQLRSFNGMGLAVTRNSSLSGAWRLGATLNGSTETGDVTSSVSTDPGMTSTSDVPLEQRYDFGVELLRLKRFSPDRRIDLELAVGPRIGLIHFDSSQQQFQIGDTGIATEEASISNQEYGVVGHLGVEVFLARSLSLHAHYGAFAGYRHTSQDVERQESFFDGTSRAVTTEFDLNQWFLSNTGVTLGVSAYL